MKKIALTVVAVMLGIGSGFAQSTPKAAATTLDNTVYTLTVDKMSYQPEAAEIVDEEEQHALSIAALPERILEQLKYSEFAAHTIVHVREIAPRFIEKDALPQYELVLQETSTKPNMVVRFDEWGKIVSKKEAAFLAQEEK